MALPTFDSSPMRAPLPTLTPQFVAQHYPPYLRVVHVDLLHRHGERTPVAHRIPQLSPKHWNFCATGNQLHQDFLRTVGLVTGSPATRDTDQQPLQWQNYVFKQDSRSSAGGSVFAVASAAKPHSSDTSLRTSATCGFGQLTDTGRQGLAALGAHMRALY
ncbi:hypothetical protein IWW36_003761, partial [Coemansia brasiliensis]